MVCKFFLQISRAVQPTIEKIVKKLTKIYGQMSGAPIVAHAPVHNLTSYQARNYEIWKQW